MRGRKVCLVCSNTSEMETLHLLESHATLPRLKASEKVKQSASKSYVVFRAEGKDWALARECRAKREET